MTNTNKLELLNWQFTNMGLSALVRTENGRELWPSVCVIDAGLASETEATEAENFLKYNRK